MSEVLTTSLEVSDVGYSEISLEYEKLNGISDGIIQNKLILYIKEFYSVGTGKYKDSEVVGNHFQHKAQAEDTILRSGVKSNGAEIVIHTAIKERIRSKREALDVSEDDINGIEIVNGKLFLYYGEIGQDGKGQEFIDVDLTRKTLEGLVTQGLTKEQIDALEESMLFYEKIGVLGGAIITVGSIVLANGVRTIKKLQIEQEGAVKLSLEGNFEVQGSGPINELEILDILESQGIKLNPQTLRFEDVNKPKEIPLEEVEARMKNLEYSSIEELYKYLEELGIDTPRAQRMGQAEFERIRHDMASMLRGIRVMHGEKITTDTLMKQIIQVPKHAKLFVIGGGLLLGLDTFSGAFSDHDDIAAYFEEAATIGGFMLGMKVAQPLMKTNISFSFKSGLKIGKRVPTAVGKVVGGIALGFGAVMGGNSFANSVLDAKNQFSRYVPEREDWFHKHGFDDDFQSSRLLNKIEGGVMYDLVDGVSQIRIGGSDAPHNRFIDWRDGMDTFMWNSGIDIATDPIEYMSYTARTVDDWNVRADVFRENALGDIKALLEKYSEKQDESNPLTSTLELLRSQKLEYETKLQAARKEGRDEYIQIYQRKLRSLQEQIQVFQETLDHETNPEERQKRFIKQVRNIIGNPEGVPLRYVNIRIYDQIIALFTAKEGEGYNALISGTTKPEFFTYIVDKELAKLRIDQEPESEKKGEYVLGFEADMLEEEMFISIALDGNTEGVEIARMRLLNNRGEVSRQMMSMDDLDFISRLPQKERDFLRKITERTLSRVRILNKGYYINHEDQKVSKDEGDIHKEYIGYSLKYTDSHHENPESNYSLTYIPSHDEIMWEYFTKGIDENITGQRILQDMQMKKIKDTAESGEVNDGETPSTPTTASKMFFRFYDRIVDLKRSQVFIANIQDRGTGRAWQSDSLEGEIEEIIGVPLRTTIRQGIAASPLLGTGVMLVDMLQKK